VAVGWRETRETAISPHPPCPVPPSRLLPGACFACISRFLYASHLSGWLGCCAPLRVDALKRGLLRAALHAARATCSLPPCNAHRVAIPFLPAARPFSGDGWWQNGTRRADGGTYRSCRGVGERYAASAWTAFAMRGILCAHAAQYGLVRHWRTYFFVRCLLLNLLGGDARRCSLLRERRALPSLRATASSRRTLTSLYLLSLARVHASSSIARSRTNFYFAWRGIWRGT